MLIEVRGLSVVLGGKRVLDRVTLGFDGGFLVLLGPNGAGKTTFMKTLVGLVLPVEGSCRVLGRDCANGRLYGFTDIVLSFEKPPLVRMRIGEVYEELCGFRDCDPDLFREVVERFGLRWSQVVGTSFTRLSAGERMKAYLAMILSLKSRLYILDEPNANLDPRSRQTLVKILEELAARGSGSYVLTTHVYEFVDELATHVAILVNGKLVYYASMDAVRKEFERSCVVAVKPGAARQVSSLIPGSRVVSDSVLLVPDCEEYAKRLVSLNQVVSVNRASVMSLYYAVTGGWENA